MIPISTALFALLDAWTADADVLERRGDARGAALLRQCADECRKAAGATDARPAFSFALPIDAPPAPPAWREKLWTCPEATRLGVVELAEAVGRPKSWVYRLTSVTAAR